MPLWLSGSCRCSQNSGYFSIMRTGTACLSKRIPFAVPLQNCRRPGKRRPSGLPLPSALQNPVPFHRSAPVRRSSPEFHSETLRFRIPYAQSEAAFLPSRLSWTEIESAPASLSPMQSLYEWESSALFSYLPYVPEIQSVPVFRLWQHG